MLPFLDRVRAHPANRRVFDQCQQWLAGSAHHLEVGCGSGEFVAAHPGAIGIDLDFAMLQTARQRHPASRFGQADGHLLPFPADHFTSCRAERALIHTVDPVQVLAEMRRVLVPTGLLNLVESDMETVRLDSAYPEITRLILAHHSRFYRQPAIGRHLPDLLRDADLTIQQVEVQTVTFDTFKEANFFLKLRQTAFTAYETGLITAEAAVNWLNDLRTRPFLASLTGVVILANKNPHR